MRREKKKTDEICYKIHLSLSFLFSHSWLLTLLLPACFSYSPVFREKQQRQEREGGGDLLSKITRS